MAINAKLNDEFEEGKQSEEVFSFRAISENAYSILQETITQLEEIKASGRFNLVDAEIKAKGQAILTILKDAKNLLDAHSDFLNWQKPEDK